MYPVIVEEYRGNGLENIHHGIICVLNEKKEVIYEKGNIYTNVFYRSALKPIQAIPIFQSNIIQKYHLSSHETALFTASQRGEKEHEEALASLLTKLNVAEKELICPESYPLNEAAKEQYLMNKKKKRKLLHNCAGKHLAFLAYVKEFQQSRRYDDPSHPLQQAILKHLIQLSEVNEVNLLQGFDGCGVPVYSIPLYNIALSYLKFANPLLIQDEPTRNAVIEIGKVMNENPTIVASEHFTCSVLLKDHNIIAKGGAQGVYCLSLKDEKISIALKVLSGNESVWPNVIAALLEQLNYKNKTTISNLKEIGPMHIKNDNGKAIGKRIVKL